MCYSRFGPIEFLWCAPGSGPCDREHSYERLSNTLATNGCWFGSDTGEFGGRATSTRFLVPTFVKPAKFLGPFGSESRFVQSLPFVESASRVVPSGALVLPTPRIFNPQSFIHPTRILAGFASVGSTTRFRVSEPRRPYAQTHRSQPVPPFRASRSSRTR